MSDRQYDLHHNILKNEDLAAILIVKNLGYNAKEEASALN
jgi:hypothetical protein